MATIINTVAGRSRLKPRREPYWLKIRAGDFLGYRRLEGASGTWIARHRTDEGKQAYKALGDFPDLSDNERFDAASKAAGEWFDHLGDGGRTEVATVADAARAYLAELRADKRDKVAAHAEGQLELHVLSHRIARIGLGKLRDKDIVNWRRDMRDKPTPQGTPRAGSTLNRVSNLLRAVLNQAVKDGYVTTSRAWKDALAKDGSAERSGGVYLDRDQRRALLQHAKAEIRPFFEALTLLPARPGAIAALTAGNFDKRTGVLHINEDKAHGNRRIKLQGKAAAFFTAQVRDKLPGALMFSNTRNTAWDRDSWSHQFRNAADLAEIPSEASTYDLRHSGITDLVTAGVPTITVATWAGTSVAQIEANYHHHAPEHSADALERLAL
ncbi:tyrosine-type recombinase/integrase [Variovorax ginsengisoli]|uniref:Tyrosine-type recombinase/integrase n=1 Tax=Variovorax ginsengisoli TaxID=363844 RepID=A0ABT8SB29_9BURK|nr:tyrosine-type recombinase/integrase [Variovorax ginsengisoli]MDN8615481.1 tyrosine-type recombinase/integrase [Variovorax ginsengisoli]MDO1534651.1 tyrosine-type recombinase/integrase [Variovorax ginsengisoli]